jgi:hypothetical protein
MKLILPAVSYGYEIWYPILREGYVLRVSGDKVLRNMFWPKKHEVKGLKKVT